MTLEAKWHTEDETAWLDDWHTHTQICLSREKRRFLIFLALWTSFRSHTMANHPKHSFNCSNPRCHHLFSSEIDDNFMIKYLKSSYKLRKEHFEPLDKRNKTEKIKYAPTHCLIMKCFSVFFQTGVFLEFVAQSIAHVYLRYF